MLCPKCGYITFDNQDACPKCRSNWSGIAHRTGGTVSAGDTECFLGKVIGEGSKPDETVASVAASAEPFTPSEEEISGQETDSDIAFDDLPEVDLSGIEDETATQESAELDFSLEQEEDKPRETKDSGAEPLGLDLNDIDLSDLVTQEKETGAGSGQSLDLDLASLEIDNQQRASGNIDLDFEDEEADLDLSLDLDLEEAKPAKKQNDVEIPDLGLSLEADEK